MIHCKEARAFYFEYLDGERPAGDQLEYALEHLNACKDCFAHVEFHRILKKLMRDLGARVRASAALEKKIGASIRNV